MNDNRARLEQAALDAVQRSGLKALSFRTLADEVGIKSSSVHYYFPEKSDLARVLIERYSIEFADQLAVIVSRRWGLRRKLIAFIAIFETVAGDRKLCLCGMMAAESELLDDANRQLLHTFFHNAERWLVGAFDAHRDELTSSLPSDILARALLSGLEGALLLDRAAGTACIDAQKAIILSLLK